MSLVKFVKRLERKKRDTRFICPKCKESQIKILGSLNGWLIPSLYLCKKCGYTGSVIIEVEE